MGEQNKKVRKNYGSGLDGFEHDEQVLIAQIAEQAIVKWPIEVSDIVEVSIVDISQLKAKLTEFLDEEDF